MERSIEHAGLPHLLGVKQMAKLASVAEKTIRRWIDRGWLRRVRLRVRRVLVRRDEFLRFLDEQGGEGVQA